AAATWKAGAIRPVPRPVHPEWSGNAEPPAGRPPRPLPVRRRPRQSGRSGRGSYAAGARPAARRFRVRSSWPARRVAQISERRPWIGARRAGPLARVQIFATARDNIFDGTDFGDMTAEPLVIVAGERELDRRD